MHHRMMTRTAACSALALASLVGTAAASDSGIRVTTWNISNYSGGRASQLNTAMFSEFEGRKMAPDLFIVQEMLSQSAANSMLSILNAAPGSPGDYAAGPFHDGPDTDNAMFYRTSKLVYLSTEILPADSGTSGSPRDVNRYDLRLVGYDAPGAVIAIYSSHMKSSSSSDSQARRLIEARKIRDNAETLNPAWNIMLGGDFNIQSSSQAAYQWLTGSQANNLGRLADPINTPGSWNNSGTYRFVHTQDPSGAGGMDDRHDQLLLDYDLGDGEGMEYKGEFGLPYSTTTWNDLNHSYRAWGNDGSTFNQSLATVGNTMVGPAIGQALKELAPGGGHLPIVADFLVPGVIGADNSIDLGFVSAGTNANASFSVGNAGDTVLWGADGINAISYTLEGDAGFTVEPGSFSDDAGGAMNSHTLVVDTSGMGFGDVISGEIRVHSGDLDNPIITIPVVGVIGGCSQADFAEPYGALDIFDVFAFLDAYESSALSADFTADGVLDIFDVFAFLDVYENGCP